MLFPGLSSSWVDQQFRPQIKIKKIEDFNAIKEIGQRFTFKGRNYTVDVDNSDNWIFREDACHPLYAFYCRIMDCLQDWTLQSRENQLANILLDRVRPERNVIQISNEQEISRLKVGQRFNFGGRIYSVKETIQGHWRVVENACHPFFDFYNGITDRIADLSLESRETRYSRLVDNSEQVKPAPLRIKNRRDFYNINRAGDRFTFKARNYTVMVDSNGNWFVEEEKSHPLYSFYCGIMDRIADCSLRSRAARLSEIITPPEQRSFQVDLNSTLWYVGLQLAHLHPDLRQYFCQEHAFRDDQYISVLVSKDLLAFLGQQYRHGAKVSIASTGKTSNQESGPGGTIDRLFFAQGFKSQDFGFKTFNDFRALAKKSCFWIDRPWMHEYQKAFLKYRMLGRMDRTGRHHILIDDRWFQVEAPWVNAIYADEFAGMGSVDRLLELSNDLWAKTRAAQPTWAGRPR